MWFDGRKRGLKLSIVSEYKDLLSSVIALLNQYVVFILVSSLTEFISLCVQKTMQQSCSRCDGRLIVL